LVWIHRSIGIMLLCFVGYGCMSCVVEHWIRLRVEGWVGLLSVNFY
jgi:hypothetical protein